MGFLFAILIGVILLIVYGSLYPWTFVAHPLFASPLYLLLHTWEYDPESRRYWADIPVNIGIYIPLGMSAYLAFRRARSRLVALAGPVVLGALLSASIEMIQLYVPGRHCSTLDLANNILGTALGVAAGIAFVAITGLPTTPDLRVRDRNAVVLLFCWVGFLLFPLMPSLSIPGLRNEIAVFIHSRIFAPVPLFVGFAEWFAVGRLLAAAGAKPTPLWMLGLFALVPAQFMILDHSPAPTDFEAPLIAILAFLLCSRARWADCAAGGMLLAATAVRALTPFHFAAFTQPFSWIPFSGFLLNSWQTSISILLGKVFQYGASLWLLGRSQFGLLNATVVVSVVLAAVEIAQTRLSAGHVPEITDPLMAILLGLTFSVLRTHSSSGGVRKGSPPVNRPAR